MAHKHDEQAPLALETLVNRLGDLEVVLGTQVTPVLLEIRSSLIAAMAARDRGMPAESIEHIGRAMDRLAALADHLDPAEAQLMRGLAQTFRTALLRGDETQVKQTTAAMLAKSGAVERKPS